MVGQGYSRAQLYPRQLDIMGGGADIPHRKSVEPFEVPRFELASARSSPARLETPAAAIQRFSLGYLITVINQDQVANRTGYLAEPRRMLLQRGHTQ